MNPFNMNMLGHLARGAAARGIDRRYWRRFTGNRAASVVAYVPVGLEAALQAWTAVLDGSDNGKGKSAGTGGHGAKKDEEDYDLAMRDDVAGFAPPATQVRAEFRGHDVEGNGDG